jgi:hypothetical protein
MFATPSESAVDEVVGRGLVVSRRVVLRGLSLGGLLSLLPEWVGAAAPVEASAAEIARLVRQLQRGAPAERRRAADRLYRMSAPRSGSPAARRIMTPMVAPIAEVMAENPTVPTAVRQRLLDVLAALADDPRLPEGHVHALIDVAARILDRHWTTSHPNGALAARIMACVVRRRMSGPQGGAVLDRIPRQALERLSRSVERHDYAERFAVVVLAAVPDVLTVLERLALSDGPGSAAARVLANPIDTAPLVRQAHAFSQPIVDGRTTLDRQMAGARPMVARANELKVWTLGRIAYQRALIRGIAHEYARQHRLLDRWPDLGEQFAAQRVDFFRSSEYGDPQGYAHGMSIVMRLGHFTDPMAYEMSFVIALHEIAHVMWTQRLEHRKGLQPDIHLLGASLYESWGAWSTLHAGGRRMTDILRRLRARLVGLDVMDEQRRQIANEFGLQERLDRIIKMLAEYAEADPGSTPLHGYLYELSYVSGDSALPLLQQRSWAAVLRHMSTYQPRSKHEALEQTLSTYEIGERMFSKIILRWSGGHRYAATELIRLLATPPGQGGGTPAQAYATGRLIQRYAAAAAAQAARAQRARGRVSTAHKVEEAVELAMQLLAPRIAVPAADERHTYVQLDAQVDRLPLDPTVLARIRARAIRELQSGGGIKSKPESSGRPGLRLDPSTIVFAVGLFGPGWGAAGWAMVLLSAWAAWMLASRLWSGARSGRLWDQAAFVSATEDAVTTVGAPLRLTRRRFLQWMGLGLLMTPTELLAGPAGTVAGSRTPPRPTVFIPDAFRQAAHDRRLLIGD